jgi:hypothetical protein
VPQDHNPSSQFQHKPRCRAIFQQHLG